MAWQEDKDPISLAVKEALTPILNYEKEWAYTKLQSRMKGYFQNAAKGLDFNGPLEVVVQQYAHSVYNSIFQALHDRTWLKWVDFLPVFFVSVQTLFPATLTLQVPQETLEQTVMRANDSAFEEQRYTQSLLWDVLKHYVHQAPVQKAVYSACEAGWKVAAAGEEESSSNENLSPLQEFVRRWVRASFVNLAAQGPFFATFPDYTATSLFSALVQAGCLPAALVIQAGTPPENWPFLVSEVKAAYAASAHGKGGKGKAGWNFGWAAFPGADAKRQKLTPGLQSSPQAAAPLPAKGPGHPLCTQAEDCIGHPTDNLQHHLSDSSAGEVYSADAAGDIYCASCWNYFSAGDPTVKAQDLGNLK